jgi:hypothetical protein
VLTDVVDAVAEDFGPYCDEVMGLLVQNLGSNEVHRSIKPQASRAGREPGARGAGGVWDVRAGPGACGGAAAHLCGRPSPPRPAAGRKP